MSSTFDPAAFAREIEVAAQADGWMVHQLTATARGPRPWFQRPANSGVAAPSVYLSSGIHGDEISGPFALLEIVRQREFLAAFNVTMFPILNPDGLANNLRGNSTGVDLNRDYRDPKTDEILSHVSALRSFGRFDAAMMLHEDFEGIGAYLYELNDGLPPTVGTNIIAGMARHVPIDTRSEIEDAIAHGGIISRKDLIAKHGPIQDRPDWPEAIYLSVHHTDVSYTTETPKPFPLEKRIAAQIAAVQILLDAVQNKVRPT